MNPLSGNSAPQRDLNYIKPLVVDLSNQSDATVEKVYELVKDLKEVVLSQEESNQRVSGQYTDMKSRCTKVITDLTNNIEAFLEAEEKLTKDLEVLEKIKTASTTTFSTTSAPYQHDIQEGIIPIISSSDLDSDNVYFNSDHVLVSSALQIVKEKLEILNKLKQTTEEQSVLLKDNLECSITLKVKELAFRIFYDKRTLPSEIDNKLSGSSPKITLQKVIEDLELKDSKGELVFQKVFGYTAYTDYLSQLKDLQRSMDLFDKYQFEKDPHSKEAHLEDILHSYSSFQIGQSKLFQGGYHNGKDAHSVVYEFKRVQDDLFELNLFNTGEGRHRIFGARVQRYSFNRDKIQDKEFLRGLFAFKIPSHNVEKAGPRSGISMKNVIEYLDNNLGQCSFPASIPSQTWGNCTYMTLKAWLHNKLDIKSYETFHKLSREHAANQLKEYLPTLSEELKYRVFGHSVISKINKKISVMSWESLPILGRIVKVFYYFSIQISNWFIKPSDNK